MTSGDSWGMLRYDGASFKVTNQVELVLDTIGSGEGGWMKDFSVIVDCVYAALSSGT